MMDSDEFFDSLKKNYSVFTILFVIEISLYSLFLLYSIVFIHTTLYEWDGSSMLFAAESITKTGFYNGFPRAFWPPLYMLFIALGNIILKNYFLSGKLISGISSIIFMIYSYKFLRTKFSPFYSFLGNSILFTINVIFFNSVGVETHMLFSAFVIISLYLYQIQDQNPNYMYLIGLLIGFSSLTRDVGLLFIVSFIIIYFGKFLLKKEICYLHSLKKILIGFFSIYIWYFLYNFIDKGVLFYDYNYLNFAIFYSQYNKSSSAQTLQYHNIFDVIFKNSLESHIYHITSDLQTLILTLWSIFGIFMILFLLSLIYMRKEKELIDFSVILAIYFGGFIASIVSPEFLIPGFPIIIYMGLIGLKQIESYLKTEDSLKTINTYFTRKKQYKVFLTLLFILIVVFPFLYYNNSNMNYVKNTELYYANNFDFKETSSFLNSVMNKSEVFMSILPIYGYYIKAIYLSINFLPVKNLFERLYYSNATSEMYNLVSSNPTNVNINVLANYLIIDQLTGEVLPDLAFLYLPQNKSVIPNYLILVKTFKFTSIYKVNQTILKQLILTSN